MEQGGRGWRNAIATVAEALVARFDGEALRVVPRADGGSGAGGDAGSLQAWCRADAGPFAVAVLAGADASRVAAAFALRLDGSDRLEALPTRAARWRLRLAVKWADAQWWRRRQPDDPWDCGLLVDAPSVRERLPHFRPRRATLMLADGLPPAVVHDYAQRLQAQQATFRHPVRLLVIGAAPAGLPVHHLQVQPTSPA